MTRTQTDRNVRLWMEHVLAENFTMLDSLEQEARAKLTKPGSREPSEADLLEEMRRLAAERNTIL